MGNSRPFRRRMMRFQFNSDLRGAFLPRARAKRSRRLTQQANINRKLRARIEEAQQ